MPVLSSAQERVCLLHLWQPGLPAEVLTETVRNGASWNTHWTQRRGHTGQPHSLIPVPTYILRPFYGYFQGCFKTIFQVRYSKADIPRPIFQGQYSKSNIPRLIFQGQYSKANIKTLEWQFGISTLEYWAIFQGHFTTILQHYFNTILRPQSKTSPRPIQGLFKAVIQTSPRPV